MALKGLFLILIAGITVGSRPSVAAETGRSAALKYFGQGSKSNVRAPQSIDSVDHSRSGLLSFSVGTLVSSKSYQWIGDDLSGWNAEVGYRSSGGEYFANSYHLELQKFTDETRELAKVSFLFSLSFPRRLSFPVYIGIAAGPGYFFAQRQGESAFSLDYKGYLGFRLNQNQGQYFIQTGVKNHVHMLSDGQFIGWFVSSGVAYKF